MDITDTQLIEIIEVNNDIYTLQNKINKKIIKLNREQLEDFQQSNNILDIIKENGFFSPSSITPLFLKPKDNFFDYPKIEGYEKNRIGIVGLPFDACSTGITGSSNSPSVLRRVTSGYMKKSVDIMLLENKYTLLDSVYSAKVHDCGDIMYVPGEHSYNFHKRIERGIGHLQTKHGISKLIAVGGDHSCTLPLVKSIKNDDLVIIKFDAHFDNNIRSDYEEINHANFICEINKMSNIKKVFHIGVREDLYNKELNDKDIIITPEEIDNFNLIEQIKEEGNNIYISIDLDVIDPGSFSSTGFLLPYGMGIEQLTNYLNKLSCFNILGIDLMEFNSMLDTQKKDRYTCMNILKNCIKLIGGN